VWEVLGSNPGREILSRTFLVFFTVNFFDFLIEKYQVASSGVKIYF
jgi:hypothetical protein